MSKKSEVRKARKNYHDYMASTSRKQRDKQRSIAKRNSRATKGVWISSQGLS